MVLKKFRVARMPFLRFSEGDFIKSYHYIIQESYVYNWKKLCFYFKGQFLPLEFLTNEEAYKYIREVLDGNEID